VAAVVSLLVLAAPPLDTFDGPLEPLRWYVGVPEPPRKGRLRIPKGGWIVSRGIADDRIEALEVVFRSKGGSLEVTFHDAREPLSSPLGEALRASRGRGERTLRVTSGAAAVDGEALPWKGGLRGTFRLLAARGAVEIDEVRVDPRVGAPEPLGTLEAATVHFATTPRLYRAGDATYRRASLLLWDVEVALLVRRGEPGCAPLAAPVRGAPVLGALVSAGDARTLALKASAHPLAMRDWGDERANLSREAFVTYLKGEYAVFALLRDAQRALNAAVPERDLDDLAHLAVIRHVADAHAAVAFAETEGAKAALKALRKALGKGADVRRASPDRLRAAAGEAARGILGDAPPSQWPGFAFEPRSRFVTIQQAKELVR